MPMRRTPILLALAALPSLAARPGAQCELFAGVPDDPVLGADLGDGVSLSGDRMLVGAPGEGGSGAAYVFVEAGGAWVQEARLVPADPGVGDLFGFSVSLAGDVALVGALLEDAAGADAGAAYVFERNAGGWQQTAKLSASDGGAGDFFGIGVSADDGRLAVGACQFGKFLSTGTGRGKAYLFERSGPAWVEVDLLEASDGSAGDRFSVSVALDGDRLLAGAEDDDDQGSSSGSAYVFERVGGAWFEVDKLVSTDSAAGDLFGFSVALDGERALVGALRGSGAAAGSGSAYVFAHQGGGVWTEEDELVPLLGGAGDELGVSVALEGTRAVVGARQDPGGGLGSGRAHVFERTAPGTWTEVATLGATGAVPDAGFGDGVALQGDRVLAGAPDWGAGTVHLFSLAELGCPDLLGSPPLVDAGTGGTQAFALRAGAAHAGDIYALLGSISGTAPGLPLAAVTIPLNPDAYFSLTLTSTPVVGALGVLGPEGEAEAALPVPPLAVLAGLTLHHAYVVLDPGTLAPLAASQPAPLGIVL